MPLEHIKHVLKPYMHDCPSVSTGLVFYPKKWTFLPAALINHVRRWATRRLGAPQNRCHERLRVKGQEEGKYDREWGVHRVRRMNGLCFSGTETGLNLRNSPKHFNRETEFLFLGGLRLLRIIPKFGIFSVSLTPFHWYAQLAESPASSFKIDMKNYTPHWHLWWL